MSEQSKQTTEASGVIITNVIRHAKKIEKYVECRVEISPRDNYHAYWWKGLTADEQNRKEIQWYHEWADEFKKFVRDHRSQDVQDVAVRVITETVCCLCGRNWEIYEEDGKALCAYCGEEVEHSV